MNFNYMEGRNTYQEGGNAMPQDPKQQIYQMLQQKGILGDMSFEEFSQMHPQEIRQLMEQSQQPQDQGPQMEQGPQQQPMTPDPNMQGIPQAGLGMRNTLRPLDFSQTSHLTTNDASYSGDLEYGARGMYQFGGGAGGGSTGSETEKVRIIEASPSPSLYDDDEYMEETMDSNRSNMLMSSGLGVGASILKNQSDSKKSADSTENAVATIGGSAADMAAAGAAFGPFGALAGGVIGAGMGLADWEKDKAAEQKTLRDANKANNVGALGNSLARYGTRTHADYIHLAERMEVERRKKMMGGKTSTSSSSSAGVRNAGHNQFQRYFNDKY